MQENGSWSDITQRSYRAVRYFYLDMRNLEETLQALYDSEINVTITMLWDGGVDFAFASSLEEPKPEDWRNVKSFADLAEDLHKAALKTYPKSDYAKKYGEGKVLPIR
jgi:hypothetical protein